MIVQLPDPILNERCKEVLVDWRDEQLDADVRMMIDELRSSGGAGLAAPQVGLTKRIIVIDRGTRSEEFRPIVMINPRLARKSKKSAAGIEECLSIPGRRFEVHRAKSVWYTYTTPLGEHKISTAGEFEARVLQHEIDHLNGITIADRGREIV